MSLTLPELKQRLAQLDLDELINLLRVTPELLVELSEDNIVENYDELCNLFTDEFSPDEWRE